MGYVLVCGDWLLTKLLDADWSELDGVLIN